MTPSRLSTLQLTQKNQKHFSVTDFYHDYVDNTQNFSIKFVIIFNIIIKKIQTKLVLQTKRMIINIKSAK